MTEIMTARLKLRKALTSDLDALHALLSDPLATRYWSTPPHEHIEETRVWLANMIAAPADRSLDFIVEYEDRCIGKAGMYEVPEIGFILRPDFWGRGLATEAVAAAVRAGFAAFPIEAITADVDPRNDASLGVLKRIGFEETGRAARTWFIGGEWHDSIYLALPRSAVDESAPKPSGAATSRQRMETPR